jgi:hypothetical protein
MPGGPPGNLQILPRSLPKLAGGTVYMSTTYTIVENKKHHQQNTTQKNERSPQAPFFENCVFKKVSSTIIFKNKKVKVVLKVFFKDSVLGAYNANLKM